MNPQSTHFAGLALGATAMATSRRFTESGVTTTRAFENELGVQPPLGFWDPAGLSSDACLKTDALREAKRVKLPHEKTDWKLMVRFVG